MANRNSSPHRVAGRNGTRQQNGTHVGEQNGHHLTGTVDTRPATRSQQNSNVVVRPQGRSTRSSVNGSNGTNGVTPNSHSSNHRPPTVELDTEESADHGSTHRGQGQGDDLNGGGGIEDFWGPSETPGSMVNGTAHTNGTQHSSDP